ncbi:hypothetical protein I549_5983 [Mycobacterium avium subsp. avium 2285 (R)]|nr:hypothetical protein I549_5983 [Mycobacterium avium subsp. avium 2285 (R)]
MAGWQARRRCSQPSGWASPKVISTWPTDPEIIARVGRPSDASSWA